MAGNYLESCFLDQTDKQQTDPVDLDLAQTLRSWLRTQQHRT